MGIAIFAEGILQWVSKEDNGLKALKEFDKAVGINPHDKDIIDLSHDFNFYNIPDEQMSNWEDADATHYPDIKDLNRSIFVRVDNIVDRSRRSHNE